MAPYSCHTERQQILPVASGDNSRNFEGFSSLPIFRLISVCLPAVWRAALLGQSALPPRSPLLLAIYNRRKTDLVLSVRRYSLSSKKAIVGHKNFSFCEQTLHKGLIDASCDWLQSTRKNRGQIVFWESYELKRLLFISLRFIFSYKFLKLYVRVVNPIHFMQKSVSF